MCASFSLAYIKFDELLTVFPLFLSLSLSLGELFCFPIRKTTASPKWCQKPRAGKRMEEREGEKYCIICFSAYIAAMLSSIISSQHLDKLLLSCFNQIFTQQSFQEERFQNCCADESTHPNPNPQQTISIGRPIFRISKLRTRLSYTTQRSAMAKIEQNAKRGEEMTYLNAVFSENFYRSRAKTIRRLISIFFVAFRNVHNRGCI